MNKMGSFDKHFGKKPTKSAPMSDMNNMRGAFEKYSPSRPEAASSSPK